jgi:hypothetical protein
MRLEISGGEHALLDRFNTAVADVLGRSKGAGKAALDEMGRVDCRRFPRGDCEVTRHMRAALKNGPHLPLGTDLLNVRYVVEQAAQQEYVVIFPEYFVGQIFEARHEPGTISYSSRRPSIR